MQPKDSGLRTFGEVIFINLVILGVFLTVDLLVPEVSMGWLIFPFFVGGLVYGALRAARD